MADQQGVHGPRLTCVDRPVCDQRAHVASESGTSPSKALLQKFRILADVAEDHGLVGHLELDFPALSDEGAGQVVIVIGVEGTEETEEEVLVQVSGQEVWVLEDLSAVETGAARDDGDAAVEGVGGRVLEVVALEVQGAQDVEEALPHASARVADDALLRAHATDAGVLEGSYGVAEEGRRGPDDVVVAENRDGCLDGLQSYGNLLALVSLQTVGHLEVDVGKSASEAVVHQVTDFTFLGRANSDDMD